MDNEMPSSIYLMHKYWGKKPSKDLRDIIDKYSKEEDNILDPFAGYGGTAIEGTLKNRNVIINDLNPSANFISKCILEKDIDLKKFDKLFNQLKSKYQKSRQEWYQEGGVEIITTLRDKNNVPLKNKVKEIGTKEIYEKSIEVKERETFLEKEKEYKIKTWFPEDVLIQNTRICVKRGMTIQDLFPKRALICNSLLYELIEEMVDCNEKELFKFAFTANIANCSKLVPPISTRGEMSQGAWMTGYYIGETYLENNVFHYFENRVKKTIKGKSDYLNLIKNRKIGKYKITSEDAKKLSIPNNTIDLVFTDFPYGDTVPYFEQSQLWNSWLKKPVDYKNEIVISNSNEREKNNIAFSKDIEKAILEISRVLKNEAYFVFTFHSLSGDEWVAINNAINKTDLEFEDCDLLLQKAFTPRQLNRKITVKGDMIVVYKKNYKITDNKKDTYDISDNRNAISNELINSCNYDTLYSTNDLITRCVKILLSKKHRSDKINFIDIIMDKFELCENNVDWRLKMNYTQLNNMYKNDDFRKIDTFKNSRKFYLLRSISKKSTFKKFCKEFNVEEDLNEILSSSKISDNDIENYIKRNYHPKTNNEIKIIETELNKMQNFDWGGSMGNNLEKNIVNNYVKKILKYEDIENAIGGNIQKSVYGYTMNSWYNHWSTIMIENIFKSNPNVLPTVDLVEKIDFFIDGIPFDLKTTYFPEELLKQQMREQLSKKYGNLNELTCLKKIAKKLDIAIPEDLNEHSLIICLEKLLDESTADIAKEFMKNIRNIKKNIISYYIKNPNELIVWLYENQGERRFDAANRFFIILTDLENTFDSWKLKRNKKLLENQINDKLNNFDINNKNKIKFHWKEDGKDYECFSEILFIQK